MGVDAGNHQEAEGPIVPALTTPSTIIYVIMAKLNTNPRIHRYNTEKISFLDIKAYLESKGYECEIIQEKGSKHNRLHIVNTDVYIDVPVIDLGGWIFASIRFEDYPKTENFEKSKKLYELLVKRFGVRNLSPPPKFVKDADRPLMKKNIKNFSKDYSKRDLIKHWRNGEGLP